MATIGVAWALANPPVPNPTPVTLQPRVQTAPNPGSREAMLLKIASEYKSYTRVNPVPYWSPFMCSGPPIHPFASESTDARTHGRKLYYLWVKDVPAYAQTSGYTSRGLRTLVNWEGETEFDHGQRVASWFTEYASWSPGERSDHFTVAPELWTQPQAPSPVGQALVKQSFAPVDRPPDAWGGEHALIGDKQYFLGEPRHLFIMTKLDPKTPDTDDGWVYAVMTPTGDRVLESGRIASCMECHQTTTRDRLYGPAATWPKDAAGKHVMPVMNPLVDPKSADVPERANENEPFAKP